MSPLVSLVIPYHDTPQTALLLARVLASIGTQTYTNYEIILVKHGSMGATYNECIKRAKGSIIKLLAMDDYFAHDAALENLVRIFDDPNVYWVAGGCEHYYQGNVGNPHLPTWNSDIFKGNNTLGGFSVIALRNEDIPEIDENLHWLVDCDWYWRIFLAHGQPTLSNDIGMVIGLGNHQTTNQLPDDIKNKEYALVTKKYE